MDIRELHIIDVDAHITEPPDLWTRRAPRAFADRVPHVVDIDGVPSGRSTGCCSQPPRQPVERDPAPTARRCPGSAFFDFERDEIHPASSDMRGPARGDGRAGHLGAGPLPEHRRVRRAEVRARSTTRAPAAVRHALQRRDGRDPGGVGRSPAPDGADAVVGRRGVGRGGGPHRGRRPARRQHLQRPARARRARPRQPEWDPFWEACAEHAHAGELPHRRERVVDDLVRHVAVAVARRRAQARDRLGDDVPVERAHHREPDLLGRARAASRR